MKASAVLPSVGWNLGGTAASVAVQFAALPVLLAVIGPHGVAVVAMCWLVTQVAGALEMGLAPSLAGELARRNAVQPGGATRSLLRAFEWPCAALGLAVILLCVLAAGPIAGTLAADGGAERWRWTVMLMGVPAACTLPVALAVQGLIGLGRAAEANLLRAGIALGQHGLGAVAVLLWQDATAWVVCAGVVGASGAALARWRLASALAPAPGCDWAGLRGQSRLALGLGGIGLLTVMANTFDRALAGMLLPVELFAAYSIAAMIGTGIRLTASPVFTAISPRLAAVRAQGQPEAERAIVIATTRWMGVALMPIVLVLALAGEALLGWWVRDGEVARHAALAAALLAAGAALNGLLTVPYAQQVAAGWPLPGLVTAAAGAGVGAATAWLLMPVVGIAGAALAVPAANIVGMVISLRMTDSRLRPGSARDWCIALLPALAANLGIALLALALPGFAGSLAGGVVLGGAALIVGGLAAWALQRQHARSR